MDRPARSAATPANRRAAGDIFRSAPARRARQSAPAAAGTAAASAAAPTQTDFKALYASWFEPNQMVPGPGVQASPYVISAENSVSASGAQEALRIVRRYVPGASIKAADTGLWNPVKPLYVVLLPDGSELSAGQIVAQYYDHGRGLAPWGDQLLVSQLSVFG